MRPSGNKVLALGLACLVGTQLVVVHFHASSEQKDRAVTGEIVRRSREVEHELETVPLIFELTGDFELVSEPIVFVSMSSIRNWYQR